ncbi:hypothetical protein AB0M28_36735 [Streptomyces sp. NPDC051940]|uniref:hypothetical protein n=1 Tax=Streptomyces sp. NPDC051940 TaxID=3155675 RepID=UPI0034257BB0
MRGRRIVPAGAALLLAPLLSGCSPEMVGAMGVGVSPEGHPVAYAMACEGRLEGVRLYEDAAAGSELVGEWSLPKGFKGMRAVDLAGPGPRWRVERDPGALVAGRSYQLYGRTGDSGRGTYEVLFSQADLDGLRPGQILYERPRRSAKDDPRGVAESPDEFREQACLRV